MKRPPGSLLAFGLLLLASPAFAEKWALLIGINHYEDSNRISSLAAADNDARKLKVALQETMGFPEANIDLLVSDGDTKPTRSNIISALDRLADHAKAGDTVFVFFSGHGTELDDVPYLLPYDFSGRSKFTGKETGLEVKSFNEHLRQVKAKALVMAWDMCRNDPFAATKGVGADKPKLKSAKSWSLTADAAKTRDLSAPIVATLFACSQGECSYEWSEQRRGYFAYFLEKGLRGEATDPQGNVTIGGLSKFVRERVIAATTKNEGTPQSPMPELTGPDAQDFVLATGKPTPVAVEPVKKPTPVAAEPGAEAISLTASMDVKVNVPGAKITVDRKPLAGTHFETDIDGDKAQFDVIVSAEGYRPKAAKVTLVPGKHYVHAVTLEKSTTAPTPVKEPVAKESTPAKSAGKPTGAADLTQRVVAAHAWNAFQKFTSVRVTGSARMTSPDPEDLRSYAATMTPSGNFRLSFLGADGKIEMGGTTNTSWTTQNGVLLPFEIPGSKSLFFPQTVLGLVGGALNDPSISWSMSGGDGAPYGLSYSSGGVTVKAVIDPTTFRIKAAEVVILNERVACSVQRYEMAQGVPIPMTITVETSLSGEKSIVTHTYSRVEVNVPVKPGFHEVN